MPILERELDLFPEDLLERSDLGREADSRWWALYTKARHEKELMRRLRGLNIALSSDLPPAAGLSSSSAQRCSSARARCSGVSA